MAGNQNFITCKNAVTIGFSILIFRFGYAFYDSGTGIMARPYADKTLSRTGISKKLQLMDFFSDVNICKYT